MSEPKRYIHRVARWEDLLGVGEPYDDLPAEVTAENTLEVYVLRDVLVSIVEASLANIALNRGTTDTTPESVTETEELVAQREAFLRWLQACPNQHVYMAMYPKSEWQLAEDEESD